MPTGNYHSTIDALKSDLKSTP
jgi:hypothetical protein